MLYVSYSFANTEEELYFKMLFIYDLPLNIAVYAGLIYVSIHINEPCV